ncbi:uncharacterized protein BKA55DRAFT_694414 [Fusarium redolens]|uniref:Uncharacterized protein n=1 Tax=Fusarium redolens TaxID=48865 RepID=A0A9P9JTV9_FUSRE|nr:uncharacterized protein BKA55DRAFT_694414 [Fusarium redolens]KAH7236788.1 hypothetical protein BKA55DRAFT_694414 [Fusarium redolens]
MKYSAVALLTLAQGIVAVPSLLGQIKQSQSKVLTTDQDISLSIKLSQVPLQRAEHHQQQEEICWLLCASSAIKCPEGWFSSEKGECWTCCRALN